MEHRITKASLSNILTAAGPSVLDMDDNTRKALAELWELCNHAKSDELLLSNLSDCEEYVLWKGEDDVRMLLETGCYQSEIQEMPEEEVEHLIQEVANRVDWSDVASAGISVGNDVIADELSQMLSEL